MGHFELIVRADFRATHRLRLPDGSIEPAHEHLWRVEAFIEGDKLDEHGLVADFVALRQILLEATRDLANASLNDLPTFAAGNPSTELVAKHLYESFAPRLPAGVALAKLRVWETEDCAAAYVPAPPSR